MPEIAEHYSKARNTSNLKSEERTSMAPADVLAAAGMAAQNNEIAMLLWGVLFQGKASQKWLLVAELENKLAGQMYKKRWKGNPRMIAQEVLAWTLHGTCQPCGGRGYAKITDTPSLSDDLCTHCNGTGKVELPKGDPHTYIAEYISTLTSIASGEMMKKLAHGLG